MSTRHVSGFAVGDRVLFGRPNGEKTLGEIVKINPTKAKVKTLEERGMYHQRQAGGVWTVPYGLMTRAGEDGRGVSTPAPQPSQPRPRRTEAEILEEFLHVECALSPENLTCDGELPRAQVRQRYAKLMKDRRDLIRELGREPSDAEIWGA